MRAGMSIARHRAMPRWAKSRHTPAPVASVSIADVDADEVLYS